ncbi:hypothetical protein R1flu_023009 [Riccia fluitans]|uniref:Bifunctional inhibitor/plant lipid transfer protein/seed storage helical domain-containing protein n=1 Tax=Riccia fluitans TaxID=41844 RepID=A0ABD1XQT6_9MARC
MGGMRVVLAYALLLSYIMYGTIPVEGLLPACAGIRRGTLSACKALVDRPHNIKQKSTCCRAVESFLFPGCLCLALRPRISRSERIDFSIKSNITHTVHLLWEKCVVSLPQEFSCLR